MAISDAKFDEAVSYARTIKNDHKYDAGSAVFQAARALLDDSQSRETRVNNAESYLQHSKVRHGRAEYDDSDLQDLIEHFDSLVRGLYTSD